MKREKIRYEFKRAIHSLGIETLYAGRAISHSQFQGLGSILKIDFLSESPIP